MLLRAIQHYSCSTRTSVLLLLGSRGLSGLLHTLHALPLHVLAEEVCDGLKPLGDALEEAVNARQVFLLWVVKRGGD